ncbi:hypothetical protein CARUB_v10002353mg [Capsella rubella]|uniref:Uncharacterized protein n=1 Tax=Capsella rubella TaxID=81985 RepID=R0FIK2_9BRAS|nr:hypothetical protein CARUB_v10002353mg [Capsella rubella]
MWKIQKKTKWFHSVEMSTKAITIYLLPPLTKSETKENRRRDPTKIRCYKVNNFGMRRKTKQRLKMTKLKTVSFFLCTMNDEKPKIEEK